MACIRCPNGDPVPRYIVDENGCYVCAPCPSAKMSIIRCPQEVHPQCPGDVNPGTYKARDGCIHYNSCPPVWLLSERISSNGEPYYHINKAYKTHGTSSFKLLSDPFTAVQSILVKYFSVLFLYYLWIRIHIPIYIYCVDIYCFICLEYKIEANTLLRQT